MALAALVAVGVVFPLASSARPTANTWAGEWSTNYGPMKLNAGGSGTYDNGDCVGRISGSVSGNTLKGTWSQRPDCNRSQEPSGPLEFTLSSGGRSFKGVWGYASEGAPTHGAWNGTCKSGPCLKNGYQPATTTKPTTTTSAAGGRVECPKNESSVTVVSVSGEAEVIADGKPSTFKKGAKLCGKDTINTGLDTTVRLKFADGHVVTVRELTDMRIELLRNDSKTIQTRLLLRAGEMNVEVGLSATRKSTFMIKTPTATCSVRGTSFTVSYDKKKRSTVVVVRKGAVLVTPTKKSLKPRLVKAGQKAEVTPQRIGAPTGGSSAQPRTGGETDLPSVPQTTQQALNAVKQIISRNAAACGITSWRISISGAAGNWRAIAELTLPKGTATATWTIIGKTVTPKNTLARKVSTGCP